MFNRVKKKEIDKTYLRTSIFPNVRDMSRTSISSGFAEKARRRARMSSIPCSEMLVRLGIQEVQLLRYKSITLLR